MKYEKIENLRNIALAELLQEAVTRTNKLTETALEADRVMGKLADYLDDEQLEALTIHIDPYKSIYLTNVTDRAVYENIVIALTELYNEGSRSKDWSDNIRYSFKKEPNNWDSVGIVLSVSPTVTGCKLVTEEVEVPEKVVPAHTETKTVIKCD